MWPKIQYLRMLPKINEKKQRVNVPKMRKTQIFYRVSFATQYGR